MKTIKIEPKPKPKPKDMNEPQPIMKKPSRGFDDFLKEGGMLHSLGSTIEGAMADRDKLYERS